MRIKLYIALIAAIICVVAAFRVRGSDSAEVCRQFLAEYGWETSEKYTDSSPVNIPSEFDEVYKNYNIIQTQAGLDLMPYRGKSGTRYTFEVINYPIDVGEPVYANVLCIDGKPVAGDIMTVSIHGFMHPLKYEAASGNDFS